MEMAAGQLYLEPHVGTVFERLESNAIDGNNLMVMVVHPRRDEPAPRCGNDR